MADPDFSPLRRLTSGIVKASLSQLASDTFVGKAVVAGGESVVGEAARVTEDAARGIGKVSTGVGKAVKGMGSRVKIGKQRRGGE